MVKMPPVPFMEGSCKKIIFVRVLILNRDRLAGRVNGGARLGADAKTGACFV